MAEVIKKATRDGYGNALVELAEKYDNLIVMEMCIRDSNGTERI